MLPKNKSFMLQKIKSIELNLRYIIQVPCIQDLTEVLRKRGPIMFLVKGSQYVMCSKNVKQFIIIYVPYIRTLAQRPK